MAQDVKALTRRWFDEVWNQGRESVIDELLRPDAIAHGLADVGGPLPAPETFRRFYRQFRSGIPDIHITVDQVITEGDTAAARITCDGTHSGDGMGVPATGRKVHFTGLCMIRWKDGQIAEGWNEFDAAGLMRQIAGPAAAPAKVKA
jgi:steroid delta-isomerase-like uncharacterized protein